MSLDKSNLPRGIHLIGAGGIGMSGLRKWLELNDAQLTYSDDAAGLEGSIPEDVVPVGSKLFIVSSAISREHPQCIYARENNLPIIHRSEVTKCLMDGETISVTGAHGKTSSTSILVHVLLDLPISFMIGGVLKGINTSAEWVENPRFCVVEADESDGSMNKMTGKYELITNIAEEHIDYYGSFEKYLDCMRDFVRSGEVIVAHDSCRKYFDRKDIVYFGGNGIYRAERVRVTKAGTWFDAVGPWGKWEDIFLRNLPGRQFAENCIGCMIILYRLGLGETMIRRKLADFPGIEKRMELFEWGDTIVIQDYAHHPNEIINTITTVKECFPECRINVVWEPHKFSRLGYKDNFMLYCDAFKQVDSIAVMEVYSAGEKYDPTFGHDVVTEAVRGIKITNREDLNQFMQANGGVVLAMGAGKIYKKIKEVVNG